MLVDTSVWIDHFRRGNATLAHHLKHETVWCHPSVIGELACGNLARRSEVLVLLHALPRVPEAQHSEALKLIENHRLMGRGIGWTDVHLLASTKLAKTTLWTLDKRLGKIAQELKIAWR